MSLSSSNMLFLNCGLLHGLVNTQNPECLFCWKIPFRDHLVLSLFPFLSLS